MDESSFSESLRNPDPPSLLSIETPSSPQLDSHPQSHFLLDSPAQPHSPPQTTTTHVQPSIVRVEPQGDLFPIHPFGLNFNLLLQEQQNDDLYDEYFSDPEHEQEVIDRCDITKDLEETNEFFSDPTVHGLLREWFDEKILQVKTKGDRHHHHHHDPTLRPTWSSVFGQAADITEYGDPSNLHLKEMHRPHSSNGSHSLRRLLSSSARGHKRLRFESQRSTSRLATRNQQNTLQPKKKNPSRNSRKASSQKGQAVSEINHNGESEVPQPLSASSSVGSQKSPNIPIVIGESSNNSQSIPTVDSVQQVGGLSSVENTDNTESAGNAGTGISSNMPNTTIDLDEIRNRHDQEDLELVQRSAEERAAHESRFVKTTLENNFQKSSLLIDDSILKTLSDESRFEVPVKFRPPVNYIVPQPPPEEIQLIQEPEVIVSVAIYSPVRPSQKTEEYLFLGSQTLTALRDTFYCLHDFTTRGPDELPLNAPTRNTEKKKISNSFLFIEGVFYSDSPLIRAKIDKRNELREAERMRQNNLAKQRNRRYLEAKIRRNEIRNGKMVASATSSPVNIGSSNRELDNTPEDSQMEEDIDFDDSDLIEQIENSTYRDLPLEEIKLENEEEYSRVSLDYSQVILDWVNSDPTRKGSPGFHNLQRKNMHEVLIQDLSIRINHPYLLVHQGNCEHIIKFHDLRLFNSVHDEDNRLCYPKPIFKSKRSQHKCRMCNINKAFYVTVGDRLAGETPCYFCRPCYDAFHYDENGNILYDDFRVFEYAAYQAQQTDEQESHS